jgi:hypothetical protein
LSNRTIRFFSPATSRTSAPIRSQYDATNDLLIASAFGRGAWTVANASTTIGVPGVLQITGDTDFSGEDDAGSGTLTQVGTKYFVNDNWTAIPTGPGFVQVNQVSANASSEAVMVEKQLMAWHKSNPVSPALPSHVP